MKSTLPLLLLLVFAGASQAAETRYIRDSLSVALRAAPQADAATVGGGLVSGTAVTLLNTDREMARVRTSDGREGWLAARFLVSEPIARDLLKEARVEIERLRKLSEGSEAARMISALEEENEALKQSLERVSEAGREAAELQQGNLELSEQNAALRREAEAARTELEQMHSSREHEYFRNGALAVGAGALLTLLVPWLWPKRRKSEWG